MTKAADAADPSATTDATPGAPDPSAVAEAVPVRGTVDPFAAGAEVMRAHAEAQYAAELAALAAADDRPRPPSWRLSPWAVAMYLLGGRLPDGTEITPKYIGQRRLVEVAVATLATDRALLLLGVPGTAKTWVSEHLAAAVSGDSTLLVQGTSGTPEEAIRYGWNYARLLAEGPSRAAVVPSPVMRAMERGALARIEELTRIPSDVQDALITILSEKTLPIPELDDEVQARQGFNVIATANDRDRGVNELSSALKRRFNMVVLPLPADPEEEVGIVSRRVAELGAALGLPLELDALAEIRRVVTVFRELRSGVTADGRTKLKSPTSTLSTAEAISVVTNGAALATHFGDGVLRAADVAAGLSGAVVKDPVQDGLVWAEYLETVVKERPGWDDLYRSCRDLA
jgi:MoxR-like ATPase